MRWCLLVPALTAVLSGCIEPVVRTENAVVPQSAREAEMNASARPVVSPPERSARPAHQLSVAEIQRLLMLLDRADLAMKERHYTSPVGRNAWSYYQQALALYPGHQEASAGIRKIADTYLQWGYAALQNDRIHEAHGYLDRAERVIPDRVESDDLRAAIDQRATQLAKLARQRAGMAAQSAPQEKKKAAEVTAAVKGNEPDDAAKGESNMPAAADSGPPVSETAATEGAGSEKPPLVVVDAAVLDAGPEVIPVADQSQSEFLLERQDLQKRSSLLVAQLAGYADLIAARNSRITIEAPTDADGRWLYQRLNERKEAYRIRANFRVSQQPKIRLLD